MMPRTIKGIFGIAFGHNQRHILVHSEGAGVVNHHSSVLGDGFGKFFAGAASGAGEGDVNALEVIIVLQKLHLNLFASESVFSSRTPLATEQQQFVNREVSLVQYSQEFLPNGTAGTYNRDSHILVV